MMLFKLSTRNIRKSMQNYLIYFATLILGVAIFYVFNALGSQTVMLKVSSNTEEIIGLMNEAMSVVSVFVSVVLGFLVVYASTFLMKRRKKEFGIYLTLGMGKTQVAKILVIETLLIGVISLVIGLLLGIGISQGMSVVTAHISHHQNDYLFCNHVCDRHGIRCNHCQPRQVNKPALCRRKGTEKPCKKPGCLCACIYYSGYSAWNCIL